MGSNPILAAIYQRERRAFRGVARAGRSVAGRPRIPRHDPAGDPPTRGASPLTATFPSAEPSKAADSDEAGESAESSDAAEPGDTAEASELDNSATLG